MTIQDLKRAHPGRVCICRPHQRDPSSHQVVSWICLQTFRRIEDAEAALERFEQDGVTEAVILSTNNRIVVEGDLAARFYRIFRGLEQ